MTDTQHALPTTPAPEPLALIDRFGRRHESFRIGVTDRCNLRCRYCMPENVEFLPRAELLTYEEIARVTKVATSLGIHKVRITGGEPLVRRNLPELIEELAQIKELTDLALTTNGMLLEEMAQPLRNAGLQRLNVSLDTVRPQVFREWTRRKGLDRVLRGIARAQEVGFERIRLNAVAVEGMTEEEIVPLVQYARRQRVELRFIEFMPIDADQWWHRGAVLSGAAIRRRIEAEFGPLRPVPVTDPSQPATDYQLADGTVIGLICSVTEPFCRRCDRLRMTAQGQLRNCLFSTASWDVRDLLRNGATDAEIRHLIRDCIGAKKAGHGTDDPQMGRPDLAMYQIGG